MATYVAAPALIYVGLELILRLRNYKPPKPVFIVFTIGIVLYVGITFNIGNAVLYGLILYTVMQMVTTKKKPVSYWWIMLVFAAINIVLEFVA